jgi:hypothetical protein
MSGLQVFFFLSFVLPETDSSDSFVHVLNCKSENKSMEIKPCTLHPWQAGNRLGCCCCTFAMAPVQYSISIARSDDDGRRRLPSQMTSRLDFSVLMNIDILTVNYGVKQNQFTKLISESR